MVEHRIWITNSKYESFQIQSTQAHKRQVCFHARHPPCGHINHVKYDIGGIGAFPTHHSIVFAQKCVVIFKSRVECLLEGLTNLRNAVGPISEGKNTEYRGVSVKHVRPMVSYL